jgi:hypothetical protein
VPAATSNFFHYPAVIIGTIHWRHQFTLRLGKSVLKAQQQSEYIPACSWRLEPNFDLLVPVSKRSLRRLNACYFNWDIFRFTTRHLGELKKQTNKQTSACQCGCWQ